MSHEPRPTAVLEQSQQSRRTDWQIGGLTADVKATECIDWGMR